MTLPENDTSRLDAISAAATEVAAQNVADLLAMAICHRPDEPALIVCDKRSWLNVVLTEAYRQALPDASFIDFDEVTPDAVLAAFAELPAGSLVVLIQSTSFRLEAFRIRIELFKRGLKVIEHVHLSRMPGVQGLHYIASLAYDPAYYRGVGHALKARIDRARHGMVDSGGEQLVFASPFESAKLNIGDYAGMNNIGGQFPLGEVFTEAQDLEAVNGFAHARRRHQCGPVEAIPTRTTAHVGYLNHDLGAMFVHGVGQVLKVRDDAVGAQVD